MSKVYINGKFLTQNITGVQRYAIEVLKSIDLIIESNNSIIRNHTFILLVPKNINNYLKLKNIQVKKIGFFKGILWEQLDLLFFCKSDLLINFCNSAPIFKKNQLVVIHDVSFIAMPNGYRLIFRLWYQFLISIILKRSKLIITDSKFSRNEIIKFFNVNGKKIEVIYLGVRINKLFVKPENLDKLKPFFFVVASDNPNKNISRLMSALKIVNLKNNNFLIVGGKNNTIFKYQDYELIDRTYKLGYIPDEELFWLYRNASFFIFPSTYEGFGLPPLEAMSYGCPVVTSNSAAIPEVCAGAVLYFNPFCVEDMAEKIESMLNSSSLRAKYSKLGTERSKKFSWDQCAKKFLFLINSGLAK